MHKRTQKTRMAATNLVEGVVEARVQHVYPSGVVVELPDGREAWLPAAELVPSDSGDVEIEEGVALGKGDELEVIVSGEHDFRGKAQVLVSRLQALRPEWKEILLWPDRVVKTMTIRLVTGNRAIGAIQLGVQGQVMLADVRQLVPRTRHDWARLARGDRVAGYVSVPKAWEKPDVLTLDVESFARSRLTVCDALRPGLGNAHAHDDSGDHARDGEDIQSGHALLTEIARVLVVEDDMTLALAIGQTLEDYGCTNVTLKHCKQDAAVALLDADDAELPFDLALVDLHLGRAGRDFDGLDVMEAVHAQTPETAIILMSTALTALREREGTPALQVPVCGVLAKPVTTESLLRAVAYAHEAPSPLSDLVSGLPKRNPTSDESRHQTDALQSVLSQVATDTGAQAVVLFSIHPLSHRVTIVRMHDPGNRVQTVRPNIERSPVKDVAIDLAEVHTGDASDPFYEFPRHRWLRKAYGYFSCLGVPVQIAGERPHCLFAFHWEREQLDRAQIREMRNAAVRIAATLKAERAERQLRDVEPFELLGKAYGSMAHDLGPALSTLTVDHFVRSLESGGTLGHDALDGLKKVQATLRTAARIVTTFQGIGRGERDEVVEMCLAEEVNKGVEDLHYTYPVVHQRVIEDSSFPPGLTIDWRLGSLRQLLTNLVLNADQQMKLTPWRPAIQGEVVVELVLESVGGGRWVCILVHDTGPGIHAGDFTRVFEVGHSSKPNGFGMGLDICSRLAREVKSGDRQGEVRVRNSLLFCGTTFEVRLPLP